MREGAGRGFEMKAAKREEIEWAFEQIATDIFQNIESLKGKVSEFDWHDDDESSDRDRRFFVLKNEMDNIWAEIKKYRADCWESGLRWECQRGKKPEKKTEPEKETGERDKLRLREKPVELYNQDIIELGYMAKTVVEELAKSRAKLFFEDANCYLSVFYLLKKHLLPLVDSEYLELHHKVRDFFKQDLSNDFDVLRFV